MRGRAAREETCAARGHSKRRKRRGRTRLHTCLSICWSDLHRETPDRKARLFLDLGFGSRVVVPGRQNERRHTVATNRRHRLFTTVTGSRRRKLFKVGIRCHTLRRACFQSRGRRTKHFRVNSGQQGKDRWYKTLCKSDARVERKSSRALPPYKRIPTIKWDAATLDTSHTRNGCHAPSCNFAASDFDPDRRATTFPCVKPGAWHRVNIQA